MSKQIDLSLIIGNKYNRLTVVKEAEKRRTKNGNNSKRYIECICDCGEIKEYGLQTVLNGTTKSCGCHSKDLASIRMKKINKTHGLYHTSEYNIWQSIKKRCLNKKNKSYAQYGGRGITICDAWKYDFIEFYKDMGVRSHKKLSIDRIDNNKGYFKENCRWATPTTQNQNQRSNKNITYNGETNCVAVWARKLNMSHAKLHYRLFIAKYDIEKAFNT